MSWAALISALISVFGPFLKDLIQKWIDKHFNKTATLLGDMAKFGDEASAREALFDKAIQTAGGPLRRQALRWMKQRSAANNITSINTPALQPSHGAVLAAMGHSLSREIGRDPVVPPPVPPIPETPVLDMQAPKEEDTLGVRVCPPVPVPEPELADPPPASEKPSRRSTRRS